MRKSILLAHLLAVLTLFFAAHAKAAVVSVDWKTSGDNLITQDTSSGLDWLDLTQTNNISRQNILPQLEAGGTFEGWRYANNVEVVVLWENFSIDLSTTKTINGLDANVVTASSYLGNIFCEAACGGWPYGVTGLTSDSFKIGGTTQYYSRLGAFQESTTSDTYYFGNDNGSGYIDTASAIWLGHYLVRETVVPIPSAIWLFGSGLIGLIGLARRKPNTNS